MCTLAIMRNLRSPARWGACVWLPHQVDAVTAGVVPSAFLGMPPHEP